MHHLDDIRQAALTLPHTTEDFPFDDTTLAFRVGNKLFALLNTHAQPLRINLKCDPELAPELRARYPDNVLPGYHMNKRHWNTLILDGQLDPDFVREQLTHSYTLIWNALSRKQREALAAAGS